MDLPRFTSGQIGNLTYAHLNEAFQLLDKLRPLLVTGSEFNEGTEALLIARITGTASATPYLMTWEEVVLKEAASVGAAIDWQVRDGGRSSGTATSTDFAPAFQPPVFGQTTATPLAAGSVVLLRRTKRVDGKLAWMVVSSVAASTAGGFAAKIVGRVARPACTSDQKTYRWLYDWDEVTANQASGYEWATFSGSRFGRNTATAGAGPPAFNGAEVNCIVGCGGTAPSGLIESNAPIASGVVVQMSQLPNGLYYFSLGNTISVQCGGTP